MNLQLDLDLDVFDGPFDLLITLILKEEIDLWEIRVSGIIAEYVLQLADSGEFDLEATSQFVVLVASLLEMKSRLLLAAPVDDELDDPDEEEASDALLAALVRYGQFKGAAEALLEQWTVHSGRLYRKVAVPSPLRHRHDLERSQDARQLSAALRTLLREPPLPDASHITNLAVTLVRELERLRDLLAVEEMFTFSAVAPQSRVEKAVTFFALLELHNRGEVHLRQTRAFGEITVQRLGLSVQGAPAGAPVSCAG
ncbi:MAG: segregation and condensation protein A [Thermoleophilia bacterium]